MDTLNMPGLYVAIIVVAITALLASTGFFFKNILKNLSDLTKALANFSTELAVLKEHITNTDADIITITKYHNEIIEHKVALSELNVKVNRLEIDDDKQPGRVKK